MWRRTHRLVFALLVLFPCVLSALLQTGHAPRSLGAPRAPHLLGRSSRLRQQSLARARIVVEEEASPAADFLEDLEDVSSDIGRLTYQEALLQTLAIAAASLAFGLGVAYFRGADSAFEYFGGYVIEESLSVDNLFIFKLIFDYFDVRGSAQAKCLQYGIWAAAVFRLIMISVGVEAVQHFHGVLLVFASVLMASSASIVSEFFSGADEEEHDLSDNMVVKLCNRLFTTTPTLHGDHFFVTAANGARIATPLVVALACIEVSDVVFAVDSVPAVLGVTDDPFIAFTSNMFAILGLRALYRILANLVNDFVYLQVRARRAVVQHALRCSRARVPCGLARTCSRRWRLCSVLLGERWWPATLASRCLRQPR